MRKILSAAAVATVIGGLAGVPAFAQPSSGSYQNTCQHGQVVNGVLTAECVDSAHRLHTSSLPYLQCHGDIRNDNGVLACNGAAATGGQQMGGGQGQGGQGFGGQGQNGQNRGGPAPAPAPQQPPPRANNNNGRDNAIAGAVLGAIVGGVLASHQGPYDGQAFPTYGDQRYGDPRFDPRYQRGGYAEGRPRGPFIPIVQRAPWLDRRIDRGVADGSLGRRDARDLSMDLDDLVQREARYRRQGLRDWMFTDLDDRFDQLVARIDSARDRYDRRR